MCRFFAYRGDPVPLSRWLYESEHSLQHQACAPRKLLRGTVNVDGTGIAWWPAGETEPLRYVSDRPPWSDPNLPRLAPRLRSAVQIGAVRSATAGMGFGPDQVQPFASEIAPGETLVGAHNGWVGGFRGAVGRRLLGTLSDTGWRDFAAMNDSAALFVLALEHVRRGLTLGAALTRTLSEAAAACAAEGEAATLNLVLADRCETVVARYSYATEQNSLYTASRGTGYLAASEPLDPGPWEPVPAGHLVRMTGREISIAPLSDRLRRPGACPESEPLSGLP